MEPTLLTIQGVCASIVCDEVEIEGINGAKCSGEGTNSSCGDQKV